MGMANVFELLWLGYMLLGAKDWEPFSTLSAVVLMSGFLLFLLPWTYFPSTFSPCRGQAGSSSLPSHFWEHLGYFYFVFALWLLGLLPDFEYSSLTADRYEWSRVLSAEALLRGINTYARGTFECWPFSVWFGSFIYSYISWICAYSWWRVYFCCFIWFIFALFLCLAGVDFLTFFLIEKASFKCLFLFIGLFLYDFLGEITTELNSWLFLRFS